MKLTKLNELIEDGKIVKGRWHLTPHHEVQYRLQDPEETIKLSGSLVASEPEALVIAVTQKQSDQKTLTRLVKLTGTWRCNAKNQLVFDIQREKGEQDSLIFKSRFALNDHHEIVYSYDRQELKTKRKITQELTFRGAWDPEEKHSLVYHLGADTESAFRFRGSFQTKSILAKKGEIRYQIGVEASGKRKTQILILFGKWKLSRKLALEFEITDSKGKRTISFGTDFTIRDDASLAVHLKNSQGQPLGIEVILTRDLFGKDGQAFLRLKRSAEEFQAEAGFRARW